MLVVEKAVHIILVVCSTSVMLAKELLDLLLVFPAQVAANEHAGRESAEGHDQNNIARSHVILIDRSAMRNLSNRDAD
jgi:hypothetical protein